LKIDIFLQADGRIETASGAPGIGGE